MVSRRIIIDSWQSIKITRSMLDSRFDNEFRKILQNVINFTYLVILHTHTHIPDNEIH